MTQPIFDRRQLIGMAAGSLGLAALSGCVRRSDGRFVVAMNQAPPAIDYALAGGAANIAKPLFENIVEPLLGRALDGRIVPQLGDYTLSPDLKIAHFTIRRGVTFHDGSPFDAGDVKFSHERMKRLMPIYRARTRGVTRVEVIDDHRVDFHFKDNALTFVRNAFLYIYSRRYHERVGEAEAAHRLNGTGPYRMAEHRQFQFVDLEAHEAYWGGVPAIKKARMMFVPEDMTRVSMLRSGEADLVMAVPFSMVPMLQKAGFGTARADMHPTFSVRFQLANRNTPWADRRVRRAIAHAIDSNAIINGVFAGIPRHYAGFAPGEPGYDPALKPYAYDPALARKLLAEAGHPNGFAMPLVYWTNAYYGMRETTEAVVLYLRAVGIDCQVSGIDAAQGLEMNREAAKDPNARLVTIAPSLLASYGEPSEAMRQGYTSGSPYSWFNDKDFDALVKRAATSADPAEYDAALRACARKIHDEMPIIPVWNNVALYMMRPGVRFTPTARDIPGMSVRNVRLG
ncbi:ABC transporter substrate-binding protein [Sphingomonas sp. G-3-2-10]|uniref:ABC transporter substrate-binding protein n=1 Tax=Sphingomonas sp. G-3-2-10 TaxID=2728838 RepID=UPI00146DEB17|nr:ABC transporter substrate-binding protein [Sphingomonas sp. G-3-2-10]